MFNKKYINELVKKQTLTEWIMIGLFLFGMVFFSIFDINNGVVVSAQWTYGTMGWISQTFILLAAFFATITVMNRIHRFKQELPFLLLGALFTGAGLLMQGYSLWNRTDGQVGAATMAPGMVQMFIFGMSALAGLAQFGNNTENVVKASHKVFGKELLIGLTVFLIVIGPFYMIFDKFSAGNGNKAGESIDYVEWLGIIAFAASTAAITLMVVFRWTWTFIFWTIANILFVVYYILSKTEHNLPLLSLVVISGLFTVIDFYILLKWIKAHNHETIKRV